MRTKRALSLSDARRILDAARAEAEQRRWNVSIAVVDDGGFRLALERMGCTAEEVVHVAAGWWTDIEPATKLGLPKVWINLRGEPGDAACRPFGEIPDLSGLPDLLGMPR